MVLLSNLKKKIKSAISIYIKRTRTQIDYQRKTKYFKSFQIHEYKIDVPNYSGQLRGNP